VAKKKEFRYVLPKLKEHQFARIDKGKKARLIAYIDEHKGVTIMGNSDGLLYLARHIAAMALHENNTCLHVHLQPGDEMEKGSLELTIDNIDFWPDETKQKARKTRPEYAHLFD
jgi:hypothetical protein